MEQDAALIALRIKVVASVAEIKARLDKLQIEENSLVHKLATEFRSILERLGENAANPDQGFKAHAENTLCNCLESIANLETIVK